MMAHKRTPLDVAMASLFPEVGPDQFILGCQVPDCVRLEVFENGDEPERCKCGAAYDEEQYHQEALSMGQEAAERDEAEKVARRIPFVPGSLAPVDTNSTEWGREAWWRVTFDDATTGQPRAVEFRQTYPGTANWRAARDAAVDAAGYETDDGTEFAQERIGTPTDEEQAEMALMDRVSALVYRLVRRERRRSRLGTPVQTPTWYVCTQGHETNEGVSELEPCVMCGSDRVRVVGR